MKANLELERSDIVVDSDVDVNNETGTITAYLETWFDVDAKFDTRTADHDNVWLNLYADYTPKDDFLKLVYQVSGDDSSDFFDYQPTENEAKLIKEMLTEAIQKRFGLTPLELCAEAESEGPTMNGIS